MELKDFCKGIGLMEEAADKMLSLPISEEEYTRNRELYRQDYFAFCDRIKEKEDFRIWMLAYLCRFACDTYDVYMERNIEEKIFWDTFRDITYWCENCLRDYGEYGINEYGWFWRHLKLTLFRLGRLEFELLEADHDITGILEGKAYKIPKGTPIINIHIPQGDPLVKEDCVKSFQQACTWFGTERPYLCHSWLLYPKLRELLKPESNIIRFQELFTLLDTDMEGTEAEQRIFGEVLSDPAGYSEKTGLQKAAKKFLMEGKKLGNGLGIYLPGR